MSMRRNLALGALAAAALLAAACGQSNEQKAAAEPEKAPATLEEANAGGNFAQAVLEPKSGSEVGGMAVFSENGGKVKVDISIEHATPGEHAVHIHEIGDCNAEDASSAGPHWNPTDAEHGKWGVPPYHLGDIGNIAVGDDGRGTITLETDQWSLGTGQVDDVVGRAIVVHAGPDDFTSQPAGNAGARVACGVIEKK